MFAVSYISLAGGLGYVLFLFFLIFQLVKNKANLKGKQLFVSLNRKPSICLLDVLALIFLNTLSTLVENLLQS